MKFLPVLLLTSALMPIYTAQATEVTLSFSNLAGAKGVALSPFFVAVHNGTFDAFNAGSSASTAIQQLSETGSGAGLAALFAAAYPGGISAEVTASSNAFGPGIYLPGAKGSITLNLDPAKDQYLSFFSMVVPSNDRFVGNDTPTQIQLFDSQGHFTGGTYVYNSNTIWDAGAVKSQIDGAAFLAGNAGTHNTDIPGGVIGHDSDFSVYSGQLTPAGYQFTNLPGENTPLFSLSVSAVPVPGTLWLLMSCLPFVRQVRRRMLEA